MSTVIPPKIFVHRLLVGIIFFLMMVCPRAVFPADRRESAIGVLYPQSTSGSRAVYNEIRDSIARGVRSRGYTNVEMIVRQPPPDPEALRRWALQNNIAATIALGRYAHESAQALGPDIPTVVGAMALEQTPDTPGVSLTANPRLIFARLRELAPRISRILVIGNGERDAQILRAARDAGRELQLEVSQFSASDIRDATQHYYNVFRYSNPRTDAIWITDDFFVDANVTLPKIMENAWANNFVVISNVLEHVSRGALLATFVDPRGLGDRLAQIASDAASGRSVPKTFGEDVQFAVNARVASHLGIELSERSKNRYGLVVGDR